MCNVIRALSVCAFYDFDFDPILISLYRRVSGTLAIHASCEGRGNEIKRKKIRILVQQGRREVRREESCVLIGSSSHDAAQMMKGK